MEKNNILFSHTSYYVINEKNKIISSRLARKKIIFQDLIKSCDIGLSTVILNSSLLVKNKLLFPRIKTKEDYVLWLNLAKSGIIFYGLNINLAKRFDTPNSLSKSTRQKLKDAFTVYFKYQKLNFMVALIRTIILSINFIFKKKWI